MTYLLGDGTIGELLDGDDDEEEDDDDELPNDVDDALDTTGEELLLGTERK